MFFLLLLPNINICVLYWIKNSLKQSACIYTPRFCATTNESKKLNRKMFGTIIVRGMLRFGSSCGMNLVQLSSVVAEIRGAEYMTGNQDAGSRYPSPRIISQLPSCAFPSRATVLICV